ncbi:MAG: hypothetical protein IPM35_01755 [Myxococcales bacterium]|nr:hypothetical protein [Myxococcales bacterium]
MTSFRFELRGRIEFDALCTLLFELTGTDYQPIDGTAERTREAHAYHGWVYRISDGGLVPGQSGPARFLFEASADDSSPNYDPRTVEEFPAWCDTVFPREGISVRRLE